MDAVLHEMTNGWMNTAIALHSCMFHFGFTKPMDWIELDVGWLLHGILLLGQDNGLENACIARGGSIWSLFVTAWISYYVWLYGNEKENENENTHRPYLRTRALTYSLHPFHLSFLLFSFFIPLSTHRSFYDSLSSLSFFTLTGTSIPLGSANLLLARCTVGVWTHI